MVNVWKFHRIILGSSMVVSLVFATLLFDMSISEADLLARVVEGGKHCGGIAWEALDRWMGPVPEKHVAKYLPRVRFNISENFKRPVIPTVLDMVTDYKPYDWPIRIPQVLSAFGVTFLILSLAGMYTAYVSNIGNIIMMTSLMVLMMFIQFSIFFVYASESSEYHTEIKNELIKVLNSDYEVGAMVFNHFTFALNSAMVTWECCGIRGPADFLQNKYTFTWIDRNISDSRDKNDWLGKKSFNDELAQEYLSNYHRDVIFPLACCKPDIHEKGFEATLRCAASGNVTLINNVVLQIIMITMLAYIPRDFESEAAAAAVSYADFIQTKTDLILLNAYEERLSAIKAAEEEAERNRKLWEDEGRFGSYVDGTEFFTRATARRNVFVPYAKVSSLSSIAPGGHHSTEIW